MLNLTSRSILHNSCQVPTLTFERLLQVKRDNLCVTWWTRKLLSLFPFVNDKLLFHFLKKTSSFSRKTCSITSLHYLSGLCLAWRNMAIGPQTMVILFMFALGFGLCTFQQFCQLLVSKLNLVLLCRLVNWCCS